MDITVSKDGLLSNYIKIYINNILHLAIKRKDLMNVQTWKSDTNSQVVFTIELTYKNNVKVIAEYNDLEKFSKIANCIDSNLD